MPNEAETNNAFIMLMSFEQYLSDFLRELTGYIRVLKEDPNQKGIYWESFYKPDEYKNMRFYCSLDGGLMVTNGMHQFLNKHNMLGSIKSSIVSRKAGEITRQIFGDMLFEPEIYEIKDLDGFANKGLTFQDQLEIFFSNIANSGIRDWSKAVLTIAERRDAGAMQTMQPERKPGLLDGLRGNRDV